MTENDQEIYKDFNLTVSERWQQEIAGISRAIVSPNFVIIPACGLIVTRRGVIHNQSEWVKLHIYQTQSHHYKIQELLCLIVFGV